MPTEELTRIKLEKPLILHRYETEFDGGDIQMWMPKGETRITVDTNARVFYLTKEESLEESDQFVFWIKNNCYTRGKELPAINWQQALGLLYAGDYYSSVPYDISDETLVSRIELIYKEAPYDSMSLTSSGVSVPFYKFYVEIEDMGIAEHSLEDYGIYYVCAIDPAYIEITDNYAQFN